MINTGPVITEKQQFVTDKVTHLTNIRYIIQKSSNESVPHDNFTLCLSNLEFNDIMYLYKLACSTYPDLQNGVGILHVIRTTQKSLLGKGKTSCLT